MNGGTWINGRHNRGSAIEAEYLKLATAAAMGWRVLTVTPSQIASGLIYDLLDLAFFGEGEPSPKPITASL